MIFRTAYCKAWLLVAALMVCSLCVAQRDASLPVPSVQAASAAGTTAAGGDPFGSLQWPDLQREFFGNARVVFDERVQVRAPAFAEDPMNVPVAVSAEGLADVEAITVIVDRNPIRKVIEYFPLAALPRISLRFKLEQASPVRAAARTRDGVWHVGGTQVDSAGGGCTAPGATRRDGSWSRTLGDVSAKVFPQSVPLSGSLGGTGGSGPATRLRVRVMHPMDTGLVGGIPAFYVKALTLRDSAVRELARVKLYEPISENPVLSLDFATLPASGLRLVGVDNNGNRIEGAVE